MLCATPSKNYLNRLPSKKSRTWFRSTHADPGPKIFFGKYKTKTPGSGYIAIFCFKDVHFKSVRVYCARDSGKPFSKS